MAADSGKRNVETFRWDVFSRRGGRRVNNSPVPVYADRQRSAFPITPPHARNPWSNSRQARTQYSVLCVGWTSCRNPDGRLPRSRSRRRWLITPSIIPWPRSNTGWRKRPRSTIAAGLLAVFVVPALLFAYVGSRLQSATRAREKRSGRSGARLRGHKAVLPPRRRVPVKGLLPVPEGDRQ